MNGWNGDVPYRLMSQDERLRWWTGQLRRVLPGLMTLMMCVLMTVPVFTYGQMLPHIGLLGVFVWAMFQPGLMPPWLAFLLGVITDALLGLPFGVNASLLPMVALFVQSFEARFGHHVYRFDWLVLAAVTLVFLLLQWLFVSFAYHDGPLWPTLLQWATTVAAYPLIVSLCAGLQRRFLGDQV